MIDRPAWHHAGACVTPHNDYGAIETRRRILAEHFAPPGTPAHDRARARCQTCPVRTECTWQGRNEDYGVWGGEEAIDLRATRKARKTSRAAHSADRHLIEYLQQTPGHRIEATLDQIAYRLNVHYRTAARAIRRLEELGQITVTRATPHRIAPITAIALNQQDHAA